MAGKMRTHPAHDEYYDDYPEAEPQRPKLMKRRPAREPSAEVRVVGSVDYVLLFVVSVLVLFGIVMVFSASYMTAARAGDPFHFLQRSIPFAAVGFLVMFFLSNFNYELIRPLSTLLYGISIGLLVLVLFIGEGPGNVARWITLPFIGRFQPSEVARAAVIFMLAYMIERHPKLPRTLSGLAFLSAIVGIVVALIALPGGFTVAIITAAIGLIMIAIASPYFWRLAALGGIGAAGVGGFLWWQYVTEAGFRGGRFGVWLDPFSDRRGLGYQTIQSLFAIASGEWFGLGIGNSRQATFVPEAHNDIIFAIIVEELGFVGGVVILTLFALFIWRGIIASMRAPDTFSAMVALGIVFAIGFQAIINIAVVTNTIPNTGVNLPFISYGGTSLLVSMALTGILLNISRYSVQKK